MYKEFLLSVFFICIVCKTVNVNAQSKYIQPKESLTTLSNNTIVYKDVRYGIKPDSTDDATADRLLDIYLPENYIKERVPVFLFIHGGGFRNGDKGVGAIQSLCSEISSKGFAVLSINYRLTLKYKKYINLGLTNFSKGVPANRQFNKGTRIALNNATEDTQLALKWIKLNAKRYKLNTSSVAIGGSSAGAITALNVAYVSNQNILPINSVVDLWGAMENIEVVTRISPPVFICHGDSDKVVSVDFAYALKTQMDKIGNKKTILNIMNKQGHAQYDYVLNNKISELIAFLEANKQ